MLLELSVVEQRYRAVVEVLEDGMHVTEVAERYGVTRQIVHRWIGRYEASGLNGLADRSHRPQSCPHQMPPEIEAKVVELRRKHSDWGPRRLVHELARAGIDPVPGRTSVYRALIRNRLIEPKKRRRKKCDYRSWERKRPMELWQMDIMGKVFLTSGQELKAITGLDDHSRFCVAARLVERATGRAACATFAQSMHRYGTPDEVLTDNGRQFTGRLSRAPGEVLFERMCRENGINHIPTSVRSPTTIGKLERFHETLRKELFNKRSFDTIDEAQRALDVFVEEYNSARPHQSLGMRPPAERFRFGTQTEIEIPTRPRERRLSGIEVQRRVWTTGYICVARQRFSVGRHLAGQVVSVRIEGTVLHVFLDGELVKAVPRRSMKEVTQIRAHRPHRYPQESG